MLSKRCLKYAEAKGPPPAANEPRLPEDRILLLGFSPLDLMRPPTDNADRAPTRVSSRKEPMERRRQRRIKWRSSCELRANGRTVSATVLDLSEGGLSVRLVKLEQQGTAKHFSASSLSFLAKAAPYPPERAFLTPRASCTLAPRSRTALTISDAWRRSNSCRPLELPHPPERYCP